MRQGSLDGNDEPLYTMESQPQNDTQSHFLDQESLVSGDEDNRQGEYEEPYAQHEKVR